ncbi:MAG: site-2 protease family protein [Haloarculaceae archaeon]
MRNLRVVSIAGIPVYLNFTLVLFLPVLAWLISRPEQIAAYAGAIEVFAGRPVDATALSSGSTPLVLGVAGAVGLMVGVLVHELGHSWAARRYDIEIVSITLWIFGGMARMDELPEDWSVEFWVALAGPVTSVLLSTLFLGALQVTPASAPVATFVVGWLAVINLSLALFNMIPAFPMDGGRILRALMARNQPYATATLRAAGVAKVFAVLGAVFAILGGAPLLILISLFVYVAATSESRATVLRQTLSGFTARDLLREARPVSPSTSVADLLDRVLAERRMTFPVVDGGPPLGVVTLDDARAVPEDDRQTTTVEEVMDRSVATVTPDRDAFDVVLAMGEHGQDSVFVVDDGELLGVITQADIAAAIEVVQGVGPRRQRVPDPPEGYA